jgi:signal transduction histidine kinase
MSASEFIRENKDLILEKWLEKLASEIPQVLGHDRSAIENSVPDFLDAMQDALEASNTTSLIYRSKDHGKQRIEFKNYSLVHVIKEYHILKRIIFDMIDKNQEIRAIDRDVIMHAIDEAVEQAGETFYQLKTQGIVEEKENAEANIKNLEIIGGSRENFFSSVSHDLKNPINNIKLVVQLIKNGVNKLKNEEVLKIIQSSIERAETLINDLLDVNLINSGNELPIEVHECHLVAMLKDTLSNYQLGHGNKIVLNTDLDDLVVLIDCKYMMRAVVNLIDNALKYGDKSKPVTLECKKTGEQIIISVHNFGEPIPLENQANIFSRYFRVNKNKTESWGIGLSLVQGIVEAHGGKVSVDSSADEGTKFTIAIPAEVTKEHP